jgi:hypothetical protein
MAAVLAVSACGRFGYQDAQDLDPPGDEIGSFSAELLDCSVFGGEVYTTLTADFATANAVHWLITRNGNVDITEYRLGISQERGPLEQGYADWWKFDRSPELVDPTFHLGDSWSFTDDLSPATTYYAQLVGIAPDGTCYRSNIAQASTTDDLTESVLIYAEGESGTYPPSFYYSERAPLSGTSHYEYTSEEDVWENLRFDGLSVDVTAMPAAAFDRSVLEFSVRVDGGAINEWSVVQFDTANTEVYNWQPFYIRRDGQYRRYQMPLRKLELDGNPLTWDVLQAGLVTQVGVGSQWAVGAQVAIDDVRIRW